MADPGDELTVVEAIALVRARGFASDFAVVSPGRVDCGTCGHVHEPDDLVVGATMRIEGVSDPADEAAVFGLECARCGARGVLVVAFGPAASADEAAVLTRLRDPVEPTERHLTCPRCSEDFSGTAGAVVGAVVAHAAEVHRHRLDPDVVRAHVEGRHPFDDDEHGAATDDGA